MIASLCCPAVVVYACLVLLGRQIGFTLSLAGIAGFIVSIGITADSFVVYFERLKDEIREGRTLRSAVPRAWVRARRTILSADAVSFLAAAILYVLAIGDVKGFAFTLGMSTVLDLVVVFLFTHPLMAVLARFKAFGSSRSPASAGSSTAAGRRSGTPAAANSWCRQRRRHGQEHVMTRPDAGARRTDEASRWAPTPTSSRTPTRCWPRRPPPPTRRPSPTPGCPSRAGRRRRRPARRASLAHRLYNGEAGLDVVGHSS